MSATQAHQSVRFIDPAVVQRLLKASDFMVLFFGAIWLFMRFAVLTPEGAAAVGFVSIIISLAGMLILRQMGLYTTRALLKPLRGSLLATCGIVLTGAAGALFAHIAPVSGESCLDNRLGCPWHCTCHNNADSLCGMGAAFGRGKRLQEADCHCRRRQGGRRRN